MYKYFEPDIVTVLDKPVAPAKPVDKPAPKKVETPQVWKACLDKNQRQQNIYYKEYNVHLYEKKD